MFTVHLGLGSGRGIQSLLKEKTTFFVTEKKSIGSFCYQKEEKEKKCAKKNETSCGLLTNVSPFHKIKASTFLCIHQSNTVLNCAAVGYLGPVLSTVRDTSHRKKE